ncbi:hypothetical protein MKK70_26860 [Methylobacterium sp. E-041]|uniref:hypothetical protein n=1 Tax=unclassified Methylobacterium TaxID=2615210 RepID=UPI001FB97B98|nr:MULTISPECIES: hypothetical protein [unclassified Methylobacterium]MCJ2037400.1 hypothetical protein [Methylobacterium sp. J-059]MCJ2108930.1 hypothetical protein [Methylobacterium sp. E-041]
MAGGIAPSKRQPSNPLVREAAIDFLDWFGEDTIALGWMATSLFGLYPPLGVVRVDY